MNPLDVYYQVAIEDAERMGATLIYGDQAVDQTMRRLARTPEYGFSDGEIHDDQAPGQ